MIAGGTSSEIMLSSILKYVPPVTRPSIKYGPRILSPAIPAQTFAPKRTWLLPIFLYNVRVAIRPRMFIVLVVRPHMSAHGFINSQNTRIRVYNQLFEEDAKDQGVI